MKRLLVLVVAVVASSAGAKEAFDIARFVPPAGWQRNASPGLLGFQAPPGQGSGQIFLFPSAPSRGSPEANFRAAWARLVAAPLAGLAPGAVRSEATPEGWTAVVGAAPYTKMGGSWRAVLLTATGHGRAMSVVVHLLGTAHDAEVDAFFRDLDLVADLAAPATAAAASPEPGAATPGGAAEAGGILFTPPRGWSRGQRADAVTYASPPYPNTGERCELTILPLRRSTGDLMREAVSAFQALFKADPMTGYPANDPQLVRGTSPFGWSYVQIQKTLGPVGEGGPGIILFMALAGDQLATVFTVSKRPLVSQCFGEAFPSEWPAFFHSLRFKAWPPKVSDAEMRTKLAGKWTTTSAHAIDHLTLATNGRYANSAALGNATRISTTTVLWTMNTFRGNGAWSVKGASLVLKPDQGAPEGGTFRLEQESNDGRTWSERLCVLGSTGDICYRRDQS